MAAWYTTAEQSRILAAWPNADVSNEEVLGFVLDTARLQVVEFAPKPTEAQAAIAATLLQFGLHDRLEEVLDLLHLDPEDVPFNLVYAQLQQVKNLWAAGRASQDGEIGSEGFMFIPRPLDKTIRSIIRPITGEVGGGF